MRFDVMTIFPKMFQSPFEEGLVAQAIKADQIKLKTWDIRAVAKDNHKSVDDCLILWTATPPNRRTLASKCACLHLVCPCCPHDSRTAS